MASTSPPVSTTPAIGDERNSSRGCKDAVASICRRRSGDAFRTNQSFWFADTASDTCERTLQPHHQTAHADRPARSNSIAETAARGRAEDNARTIRLPRRICRRQMGRKLIRPRRKRRR